MAKSKDLRNLIQLIKKDYTNQIINKMIEKESTSKEDKEIKGVAIRQLANSTKGRELINRQILLMFVKELKTLLNIDDKKEIKGISFKTFYMDILKELKNIVGNTENIEILSSITNIKEKLNCLKNLYDDQQIEALN